MTRPVDERLFGAWIPDPGQADAERWASMEISPAGWLRFIVHETSGPRAVEHEYRVPEAGQLRIEEPDGRWTEQHYLVEDGPVLVIGARRFVPTIDPADRPWPAGATDPGAAAEASAPAPTDGAGAPPEAGGSGAATQPAG